MYRVTGYIALFFDEHLERLQQFEVLHVGTFRFDQFVDDVLSLRAFHCRGHRGIVGQVGLGSDDAHLHQDVEHPVHHVDDLDGSG